MLDEIESLAKIEPTNHIAMEALFTEWKTRTEYSQYSLCNLEPVLRIRRALLELAMHQSQSLKPLLKSQLGECWLTSAKVARKARQLNKAYNLLLEAEKFNHKEVFIEKAKLCWARESKTEAISVLEKGISDRFPELKFGFNIKQLSVKKFKSDELAICGKAKLLLGESYESF